MLKMKQSRKWLHVAGHTNKHSSIGTSPTSLILRGKRVPGNVFFNYEEVFSNMRRNSNGKVPELPSQCPDGERPSHEAMHITSSGTV